jgi:hypothetical protein
VEGDKLSRGGTRILGIRRYEGQFGAGFGHGCHGPKAKAVTRSTRRPRCKGRRFPRPVRLIKPQPPICCGTLQSTLSDQRRKYGASAQL